MDVREGDSAADFLAVTEAFRSRDAVMTNLLASIAAGGAAGAAPADSGWLVVVESGDVIGCAVRTPPRPVVLSPMSAAAAAAIGRYCRERWSDLRGVNGPPDVAWAAARGAGVSPVVALRMVVRALSDVTAPHACPGAARRARASDVDLIVDWYAAFGAEVHAPASPDAAFVAAQIDDGRFWLWEDAAGEIVAMAGHARVVEAGEARIGRVGPVYVPSTHRRRGYGAGVTHAVADDLISRGCRPMLMADADNPRTNRLYERMGFRAVGELIDLTWDQT